MKKRDESVTLKILRKMYPYYDKDYDAEIMDILREYYNDLLYNESNIPPRTGLFKEAIVLKK